MNKIGIITYHFSDNFGSVLQAYAMQNITNQKFGYCEIIDYRKKEVEQLYKIFKPFNSKYNFITNLYVLFYYARLKARKAGFKQFRNNYMNLSSNTFENKEQLNKCNDVYDIFICGSDQVWNFDIVDFDTSYMLDFVDKNKLKLSYAASMGPKQKNENDLKKYKELLNTFDGISVREDTAKNSLENIIDKKVDVVIDPVLLMEKKEWECIAESSSYTIKDDYVLCYFPGCVSKEMENFSSEIAKKYNCKRVLLMPEWRNFSRSGEKAYDTNPNDFIKLIKNAKYICTNSFHGTAFALIFNVEFFVEIGADGTDDRILTLLSKVGLNNRIINNGCENSECCFDYSNEVLSQERKRSLGILKQMICGEREQ